jgi:hypothetical protein
MTNKILSCLIVGALGTTLALASPAFARGGGGGMGGGGMGGGMHAGGMGGGPHFGGIGGGQHFGGIGGGQHFGAMNGGMRFSGTRFATAPHAAFVPRFSRFASRDHRFFRHHRFNRFAFGAPFAYAAYDTCLRRVWTPYGVRWVNVCGNYGYY